MWWKLSHPFVRQMRHTEALSALPIARLHTRQRGLLEPVRARV